ncbi:MAG: DNA polymerase III subunit gamma/tau [Nitrospirota bacterium]
MDHQVTALKFRPQTFDELVGQATVARTLRNALRSGRLAHGFLFAGPRGVGKTTTARLLAKGLNCLALTDGQPCNACDNCRQVAEGRFVDVIEIDGASNNGVEHIRNLREQVQYLPAVGEYKVYLIDEVHMLSGPAFNALLKTLEEPPSHVVFIFATTELHKVPATIVSRCQRYEFQRIREHDIVTQLRKVAAAYEMSADEEALWEIAVAADGSLRDAQSLFDQASAFGELTVATVQEVLGLVDRGVLTDTVAKVAARDGAGLLAVVDTLTRSGHMLDVFLRGLAEQFRHLLVLRTVDDAGELVPLSEAQRQALLAAGAGLAPDQIERSLGLLLETGRELRGNPLPRFAIEVGLLRLLRLEPVAAIEELLSRMESMAASPSTDQGPRHDRSALPSPAPMAGTATPATPPARDPSSAAPRPPTQPADPPAADPPAESTFPEAADEPIAAIRPRFSWPGLLAAVRERRPSLAAVLEYGHPVHCGEDKIEVAFSASFYANQVEEDRALVEEEVRRLAGPTASFIVYRGERPGSRPSVVEERTASREAARRQLVEENPRVTAAVETFDGNVVDVHLGSER